MFASLLTMTSNLTKPNLSQVFTEPIKYYDIHVYFNENDIQSCQSVEKLRSKLMAQFPDLRVFDLVPYPVGPHPIGMVELHLYNPSQFSQVIPWLAMNRGEHGALIHPNTPNALLDHTEHAMWLGPPLKLSLGIFDRFKTKH